jgi:Tol biopolymer transport system component
MYVRRIAIGTGSVRVLALATIAALVSVLVVAGQSARATYPGSTDGRLAIGAEIDGNVDIYTVLPSGASAQRLTTDPLFDACPAWSADGKRLAWCHGIRAKGGNIEIWTMKLDGTAKTQVTGLGGRMTFPDFSPSGSRIAFSGRLPGATNDDVFSIGAGGTGLVQLTNDPANDSLPAYSPDGSKIAFISGRSGLDQVWVMGSDGSEPTQLTFDDTFKGQVPDWSPDGSKIAYAAGDPGDVLVMDADGSDQHTVIGGPTDDFGPAWSPDGQQLAFIRFDDRTVYVANADGSGAHIVRSLGLQAVPAWQPRGDRNP